MYGFSVYLNEPINQKNIENLVNAGFTGIFTSIHIPEDDDQQYLARINKLGQICEKNHLSLVVDISGASLEKIGGSFDNSQSILDLGITGLRIDYGIGMDIVARLSRDMHVALNASTLTAQDLDQLHKYRANLHNITAWHNYYPRPETGLDMTRFKHHNQWLKSTGLRTMAFVVGDGEKRGPIFAGLPTIENHRNLPPLAGALDLKMNGCIDDVYIGDPGLKPQSLFQFEQYIKRGEICIKVERASEATENQLAQLLGVHTNRQDAATLVVRSQEARLQLNSVIKPINNVKRSFADITVDNERYGRYHGEMQICLADLPEDDKVNVVGQVVETDRSLLSFIGPGQKFKLQLEDKKNECTDQSVNN
ncbi:MupG family TIM beta-alpha barrel fold protein [Aerococcaceae bacterium 50-4]